MPWKTGRKMILLLSCDTGARKSFAKALLMKMRRREDMKSAGVIEMDPTGLPELLQPSIKSKSTENAGLRSHLAKKQKRHG